MAIVAEATLAEAALAEAPLAATIAEATLAEAALAEAPRAAAAVATSCDWTVLLGMLLMKIGEFVVVFFGGQNGTELSKFMRMPQIGRHNLYIRRQHDD